MNAQQLKNSILDYAFQGKLVPQDPNDEPAQKIIQKIYKEKEFLVLEKTIKSNKKLPPISEEDIPNDIPESWEWVRLNDLAENCNVPFADGPFGSNLKKEHYISSPEVRIIQLSNIGENGWQDNNVKYTSFQHLETIKRSQVNPGDIVISKMMPAGRAILVPNIDQKYVLSSDAVKFVPHKSLNKTFLLYAINSNVFRKQIYSEVQGITRVRTSLTKIKKYLLPIPPIEEQHRIVRKINELFEKIERLSTKQKEIIELQNSFPSNLEKSILQYALQGKLVKQDSNDEPAMRLIEKIRVEKERLIQEKVIKKEKPLPMITEEEIPFDIPSTWEWVRLNTVVDVRDGTHDTPKYVSEGVPLVTSKNLNNGEIDFENIKFISYEDADKINQRSGVDDGDILFAMIGSIGNPVLVKKNREFSIKNMALFKPINTELLNMEYLYWFLKIEQDFMKKKAAGGVQSFVSLTFLRNYLIPLPPLKEQNRIVKKIEELLPYVRQMIK